MNFVTQIVIAKVALHIIVNVMNNKREYSYDEVIKLYEKIYNKSNKFIQHKSLIILLIFVLFIIGIYYYTK